MSTSITQITGGDPQLIGVSIFLGIIIGIPILMTYSNRSFGIHALPAMSIAFLVLLLDFALINAPMTDELVKTSLIVAFGAGMTCRDNSTGLSKVFSAGFWIVTLALTLLQILP